MKEFKCIAMLILLFAFAGCNKIEVGDLTGWSQPIRLVSEEVYHVEVAVDPYNHKTGLAYISSAENGPAKIYYQEYDGAWQPAQEIGLCYSSSDSSIAFTSQGEPVLAYYNESYLHCARLLNGVWQIDVVSDAGRSCCDLVIHPETGVIHIFHTTDGYDYNLWHSEYLPAVDGGKWFTKTLSWLDANGGDAAYDPISNSICYAYKILEWQYCDLEFYDIPSSNRSSVPIDKIRGKTEFVGRGISLAFDPITGYPMLTYGYFDAVDSSIEGLRLSAWDGTAWGSINIKEDINILATSAHADLASGNLRVLYDSDIGEKFGATFTHRLCLAEETAQGWVHRNLVDFYGPSGHSKLDLVSSAMTPQGKHIAAIASRTGLYVLVEDGFWPYEPIEVPSAYEDLPIYQRSSGVNYPWNIYGADIGIGFDGSHLGFSGKDGWDKLNQHFRRIESAGVGVVRVFLFCDLRSGLTEVDGRLAFDSKVYGDMAALLVAAKAAGLQVIPVLFDFHIANGVSSEYGNLVGERPELLTTRLPELLSILSGFLATFGDDPAIAAWDVMNEPDFVTAISQDEVKNAISQIINLIHANASQPVTVGAASYTSAQSWKGYGLDLYQFHHYDVMGEIPSAGELGFDKPVFIGELEPRNAADKLSFGEANGYLGMLFWSFNSQVNYRSFYDIDDEYREYFAD